MPFYMKGGGGEISNALSFLKFNSPSPLLFILLWHRESEAYQIFSSSLLSCIHFVVVVHFIVIMTMMMMMNLTEEGGGKISIKPLTVTRVEKFLTQLKIHNA